MHHDDVELTHEGEVAVITLRRPERDNAMRGAFFDQLRRIGLKLADAPPKFVVLCGEGEHFSSGLDRDRSDPLYQAFEATLRGRDAYKAQELVTRLRGAFEAIGRLPCPVISAVEGRCEGAGFELALVSDLRIAAEGASFALVDARFGVLTGFGGLSRVSAILGSAVAAERALSGRPFSAAEALLVGLVSRIAPKGQAKAAAMQLVAELKGIPAAARTQTLLALRTIAAKSPAEGFEAESQAASRVWISPEWQAALPQLPERK